MTNEEMIETVRATWDKYGELDNPGMTTTEVNNIDDLLDDVERLVREH